MPTLIALRAFNHVASSHHGYFNVTGPETLSVCHVAERSGCLSALPLDLRGTEAPDALLSDATLCCRLFGPPRIAAGRLIEMTAEWLVAGRPTLDKPTHFEARDGRF